MVLEHKNFPIYGFQTEEAAENYIEKNFMNTEYNDVEVAETINGDFKIIKKGS